MVTVCTKDLAFRNFGLDAFNRETASYHPSNCHILLSDMVKFQNTGIALSTLFTWMGKKILVNKFPCGFTGSFCSFLYLL
jgi:hypothetical protein